MKPALRIAFRVEGNYWNAYIAETGTMDKALLIGSISMTAAAKPEIKQSFMDLMRRAFEAIAPFPIHHWDVPHAAPEHERSGRA